MLGTSKLDASEKARLDAAFRPAWALPVLLGVTGVGCFAAGLVLGVGVLRLLGAALLFPTLVVAVFLTVRTPSGSRRGRERAGPRA